jgi:hypothetical protein
MKSTHCRECGHYTPDIVAPDRTFQLPPKNIPVDGTHSPVECPTKPTFNTQEAKSMTHLFRQIRGQNSNSPNLLQMVPGEATKKLNRNNFSFR